MEKDAFLKERILLGRRITFLRKKCIDQRTGKPISQEELALRTGFAKNHIGKIERGQTNAKVETLFSIAKELGVDIRSLFNFDEL